MALGWIRLDASFYCAPSTLQILNLRNGHRTMFVHIAALCHTAKQETDGFIPRSALHDLRGTKTDARRLVSAGLWWPLGDDWMVADWWMYIQPDRRPYIPVELRRAVYERDGHRCIACGATERLSLDHILHWSDGGQDTLENLRTLCIPCNSTRKNRTDLEWLGVDL